MEVVSVGVDFKNTFAFMGYHASNHASTATNAQQGIALNE
jgi:hypothetical protein